MAEEVPVAPAHVEDRLDADLALHAHGHREVAHASLGARAVGDVDDVDPAGAKHLRRRDRARGIEAHRRVHLDGDDEPSARDLRRRARSARPSGGGWIEPGNRGSATVTSAIAGIVFRGLARVDVARGAGHARRSRDAPDVLRRRPAAAADEAHADADHAPRVDAEVLGGRHVDHALVDPARQPGVRRREHGQARSAPSWSTAASTPIGPSEQFTPTMLAPHSRASRAISSASVPSAMRPFSSSDALAMTGTRPSEASTAASTATRSSGVCRMVSTTSASTFAFEERARLLEEHRLDLREVLRGRVASGLAEEVPARSDGADDVRLGPRRRARDPYARGVELVNARRQPVLLEAQRVRAERVRLDDLGAGAHEVFVHLGDELGARDVELLEAGAVEHAALVELRSHGAVDDEYSRADGVDERAVCAGRAHG